MFDRKYQQKINAALVLSVYGDKDAQSFLKHELHRTARGSRRRELVRCAFHAWDYALYQTFDAAEKVILKRWIFFSSIAISILGALTGAVVASHLWGQIWPEVMNTKWGQITQLLMGGIGGLGSALLISRSLTIDNIARYGYVVGAASIFSAAIIGFLVFPGLVTTIVIGIVAMANQS